MPLKNGMPYLKFSVDSILGQTESNFKFLIVDDHSTDNSIEYLKSINDLRIEIITNEGNGIADALNTGLKLINTEYVAIMDADDICSLTRLAEQKKFLDINQTHVIVGTSIAYIGHKGNKKWLLKLRGENESIIKGLRTGKYVVAHSTIMIRTSMLKEINGYNNTSYPNVDLDMYLRLLDKGLFANISDQYNFVRLHEGSLTQRNLKNIVRQNYLICKKNNSGETGQSIFDIIIINLIYHSQKFYKKGIMQFLNEDKFLWIFYIVLAGLLYPPKAIYYIKNKLR